MLPYDGAPLMTYLINYMITIIAFLKIWQCTVINMRPLHEIFLTTCISRFRFHVSGFRRWTCINIKINLNVNSERSAYLNLIKAKDIGSF